MARDDSSNRPRIPPIDLEESQDVRGVAELVKQQRGGSVSNLYGTLLHSPPVADGWLHLGTAIRQRARLDDRSRELCICLVARLTGAAYEWHQHAPLAVAAGVTTEQLATLDDWRTGDAFDARDRALLGYTAGVTQDLEVDDETFAAVADQYERRELVELTATIGYYNCVARLLRALRVELDP